MDRIEKIHLFSLYVSLKSNNASLLNEMFREAAEVADHYPEATWLSHVLPKGDISVTGSASTPSLFSKLRSHLSDDHSTAFLVTAKPHHLCLSIDGAATLFDLPDFHGALGDFFSLQQTYVERRGHRKSGPHCQLPFTHVHIWNNFKMQQFSSQDPRILLPSRTVQALPPSGDMPHGRCNTVLVGVTDGSGEHTSSSGADGTSFSSFYVFLWLILLCA
jgi:hypothetical protein